MENDIKIFFGAVSVLILLLLIFKFRKRFKFTMDPSKGSVVLEAENHEKKENSIKIVGGYINNSGKMKVAGTDIHTGSFDNNGEVEIVDSNLQIVESQSKNSKIK